MQLEKLIDDFPQQFKGKKNIEAIATVLDKQVKQLTDVFHSIMFDTALDTAVGKQLDRIGEIVGLTRAEATKLCGKDAYFTALDDEKYRAYLKYKAYKNSNGCTYYDLIAELKMATGIESVKYEEDELYPATAILTIPLSNNSGVNLGQIPALTSAGVSVLFKYGFGGTINVSKISKIHVATIVYCGAFNCGTHPKTSNQ